MITLLIGLLTICVVVKLLIFYYRVLWCREAQLLNKLPGPRVFPFFGSTLMINGSPEQFWRQVRELNQVYNRIWKFWYFSVPLVNLCHPNDVEVLLNGVKHIEKGMFYDYLHPWFGTGLLTSTGQKWQTRRRILTPAFHFNILQQFVDVFVEEGERLVEYLRSKQEKVVEDLMSVTSEFTLNAICETAMGTSIRTKGAFQAKYRRAVQEQGSVVVTRLIKPWLQPDLVFSMSPQGKMQSRSLEILHNFTNKIIEERKNYHDQTNEKYLKSFEEDKREESATYGVRKRRLAMLDLLLAKSRYEKQIDDPGIREEVDTFMFEGHDTSSAGMCASLVLLAEHKEVQEKCRAEIDSVLKECDGKITMSMLQRLPYLERCIKESLRLYPSVPFIARKISEDIKLDKYTIPAGTFVHVHIYEIHRDPNFWPNPTVYDPDRFLPDRIQGRHPYCYLPFSAGPRNCIGQRFAMLELKAMIAQVLHAYRLEPIDRISEVPVNADLVYRPAKPIRIKFIPIR